MECSICGNEKQESMLFSAITKEGVVRICERCSRREDIPIMKKIDINQFRRREYPSTYDRLSAMAKLNSQEHKERIKDAENIEKQKQNEELRRIISKKELAFPNLKQSQPEAKSDLIRNYHWEIFNARRAKKLTQKQLAEEMTESETTIKLAEKGTLPDNYVPLIRKLQVCLNITLFNNPQQDQKHLGFDKFTSKELTLSDLQEISGKVKKSNSNSFFPYWKRKLESFQKKRQEKEVIKEIKEIKESNYEDEYHKREPMRLDFKEDEKTHKERFEQDKKLTLTKEEIDRIMFDK